MIPIEDDLAAWVKQKSNELWKDNPFNYPGRVQPWPYRRQLLMHVMRLKGASFPVIGRVCGCSHTNVIYADRMIAHQATHDSQTQHWIRALLL